LSCLVRQPPSKALPKKGLNPVTKTFSKKNRIDLWSDLQLLPLLARIWCVVRQYPVTIRCHIWIPGFKGQCPFLLKFLTGFIKKFTVVELFIHLIFLQKMKSTYCTVSNFLSLGTMHFSFIQHKINSSGLCQRIYIFC
jgi:hypothetical protein